MSNNSKLNAKPWMPGITPSQEGGKALQAIARDLVKEEYQAWRKKIQEQIDTTMTELCGLADAVEDHVKEILRVVQAVNREGNPIELIRTDEYFDSPAGLLDFKELVEATNDTLMVMTVERCELESLQEELKQSPLEHPAIRNWAQGQCEYFSEDLADYK